MPRELLHSWPIGKNRATHAGYAVYVVRDGKPTDRLVTFESAEEAVASAERLGDGHGAFRLVKSKSGIAAKERIVRDDLPIHVVLNPTPRR